MEILCWRHHAGRFLCKGLCRNIQVCAAAARENVIVELVKAVGLDKETKRGALFLFHVSDSALKLS